MKLSFLFTILFLDQKIASQSQPMDKKPYEIILDLGKIYKNEKINYCINPIFGYSFADVIFNEANTILIEDTIENNNYELMYADKCLNINFNSTGLGKSFIKKDSFYMTYLRPVDAYIYQVKINVKFEYVDSIRNPKLFEFDYFRYSTFRSIQSNKIIDNKSRIQTFKLENFQRVLYDTRKVEPIYKKFYLGDIYKDEIRERWFNNEESNKILIEHGDRLIEKHYKSNQLEYRTKGIYLHITINSKELAIKNKNQTYLDTIYLKYHRDLLYKDTHIYYLPLIFEYEYIAKNRVEVMSTICKVTQDSFQLKYQLVNNSHVRLNISGKKYTDDEEQFANLKSKETYKNNALLCRYSNYNLEKFLKSKFYKAEWDYNSMSGNIEPILQDQYIIYEFQNYKPTIYSSDLDIEKLEVNTFPPLFNCTESKFNFIGKYKFDSTSMYKLIIQGAEMKKGKLDIENSTMVSFIVMNKHTQKIEKSLSIPVLNELWVKFISNMYDENFNQKKFDSNETLQFEMKWDLPKYVVVKYTGYRPHGHGRIIHSFQDSKSQRWIEGWGYDTWYDCGDRQCGSILKIPKSKNKFCFDESSLHTCVKELNDKNIKIKLSPNHPKCVFIRF